MTDDFTLIEKIYQEVQETEEEFIFKTILPYCERITEKHLSKQDINKAFALLMNERDAIEAVPLEPLCQWLAGYAAPPNYALEAVFEGYKIQPNLPIISVNYYAEAWKLHFLELLKSGLMDTEGEDAENK